MILETLKTWCYEGGWPVYLVLLLSPCILGSSIAHAALQRRGTLLCGVVGMMAALLIGAGGTMLGRSHTDRAVATADPSEQADLQALGYQESAAPLKCGACVAGLSFPALLVGEVLRRRKRVSATAAAHEQPSFQDVLRIGDNARAGLLLLTMVYSGRLAGLREHTGPLLDIAELIGLVLSTVFFVGWMRRAYANGVLLSPSPMRYSPTAVAWAFFIPFVNLIRPYRVVDELWRMSDPATLFADNPKPRGRSPYVDWWWITFALAGAFDFVAGHLIAWWPPRAFYDGTRVVAASLAMEVLVSISRDQTKKWQLIQQLQAGGHAAVTREG